MTIGAADLQRLLGTDGDAVLVVIEGRTEVVTAGQSSAEQYRGALEIISRDELLKSTGGATPDERVLEEQAAALTTAVDELGG